MPPNQEHALQPHLIRLASVRTRRTHAFPTACFNRTPHSSLGPPACPLGPTTNVARLPPAACCAPSVRGGAAAALEAQCNQPLHPASTSKKGSDCEPCKACKPATVIAAAPSRWPSTQRQETAARALVAVTSGSSAVSWRVGRERGSASVCCQWGCRIKGSTHRWRVERLEREHARALQQSATHANAPHAPKAAERSVARAPLRLPARRRNERVGRRAGAPK